MLSRSSPEGAVVPARALTWVPPGHFYSPIVDLEELDRRRAAVFDRETPPTGVDLNAAGQLEFLNSLAVHKNLVTFSDVADRRYSEDNPAFNCADAWALASILIEARPRRLIEIGCGHSSAMTMDVCEHRLGGSTDLTFVDPYPALLTTFMRGSDRDTHRVIESPAQDVDPSLVDELDRNDILFIDSTHVAKAGSDVLFDFFQLLPRLRSGVLIHIHDIPYPFEYMEAWFFEENRSWNEAYVLRALLTGSERYEIVLWNHYLSLHHSEAMMAAMPPGSSTWGSSIWLRVR